MLRSFVLTLVGYGAIVMDGGAHSLYAQGNYPRVYGPTGRPYGPTQSHYQYERQYGRPWPGGGRPYNPNTGAQIQIPHGHGHFWGWNANFGPYGVPYQGYGYAGYGLPGYNPYLNGSGWVPPVQYQPPRLGLPGLGPVPTFSWQQPDGTLPLTTPPQAPQPMPGGGLAGQGANPILQAPVPVQTRPHNFMPAQPSSTAQRQRSLHLQGQGDIWFRNQNYLQAYSRYKQAAAAASDLPAPRFRMAYALIAMQRFELAVTELQKGIRLDPQYPLNGDPPEEVYGEENRLAAATMVQALTAWVKQDVRSPDRLFLLGAILTISGDIARAQPLLQTAAEFGGPSEHVLAFLQLTQPQQLPDGQLPDGGEVPVAAPLDSAPPMADQPPVPEEVQQILDDKQTWLPSRPRGRRPSQGAGQALQRQPSKVQGPAVQGPLPPPQMPVGPTEEPRPESVEPDEMEPEGVEVARPAGPKIPYPVQPGFAVIPKKGAAPSQTSPMLPSPPDVPATNSDDSASAAPDSTASPETTSPETAVPDEAPMEVVPAGAATEAEPPSDTDSDETSPPAESDGPIIPVPNSSGN